MGGGGIFEAEAIVVVGAGDKVIEAVRCAADLEGGFEGIKGSAVDGEFVVLEGGPGFGGDINDAGGVEAELRGEAAGDEGGGLDETGIELLGEAFEGLGEEDAVDAVGEIGVFAADMLATEGVGDDTWACEEDCWKGAFSPPGDGDLCGTKGGGCVAEAGSDAEAGLVEWGDDDFIEFSGGRGEGGGG